MMDWKRNGAAIKIDCSNTGTMFRCRGNQDKAEIQLGAARRKDR